MVEVVAGEIETVRNQSAHPDTAIKSIALERLAELEQTIARGLDTFREVGVALVEIADFKLYLLAGFKTFPAYTEVRWGLNRTSAYNKMYASRVIDVLTAAEVEQLPTNETQAKTLSKLLKRPEALAEAWKASIKGDAPPTQDTVRRAVNAQLGKVDGREKGRPPIRVKCPECSHVFGAKDHYVSS